MLRMIDGKMTLSVTQADIKAVKRTAAVLRMAELAEVMDDDAKKAIDELPKVDKEDEKG